MTAHETTASHDELDATQSAMVSSGIVRSWACAQVLTADESMDRHGARPDDPDDPDDVEYHARCCPTCTKLEVSP